MNLLLITDEDFLADGTVRLCGRRAWHAREVLKAEPGERLRVGRVGGLVGDGEVLESSPNELRLRVLLAHDPPPRPEIDLLLAMPRPKALKRILPAAASLGVDRIVLMNAYRVEKSYFQSKVLGESFVHRLLLEGLQQARDTRLPTVLVRDRLRPFVEDELGELFGTAGQRLIAHPAHDPNGNERPTLRAERTVIAIGPEGGWIPFELELFKAHDFQPIALGPRTLRVEAFVPFVLGWLHASTRPLLGRIDQIEADPGQLTKAL